MMLCIVTLDKTQLFQKTAYFTATAVKTSILQSRFRITEALDTVRRPEF
jgi:hypothetical protein